MLHKMNTLYVLLLSNEQQLRVGGCVFGWVDGTDGHTNIVTMCDRQSD